jgi:hypothetical protein
MSVGTSATLLWQMAVLQVWLVGRRRRYGQQWGLSLWWDVDLWR